MAGYTDEEIANAVSQFVQSTLRIERSPLGPVDADSKFNEVVGLISSTLIYDPNAIFYLIFLASNHLNKIVETEIGYVDDVLEAIDEMGKRTKDVTKTTLLGDAAAALLTVDQILTDRNTISSQAYSRYQASIDAFTTASLEPNIKTGTDIVRPPELARTEVKGVLDTIRVDYPQILADAEQLQVMLAEFNDLNLPVLAIQNSVRMVRSDLQELQKYFESPTVTKEERIAMCREAYLRITSGRSVLDNYTTVTDPAEPRLSSSASVIGRLTLSISGGLVPATVTGTKSGPWAIVTGVNDGLNIAEDGNAPTAYTITAPSQPSVRCYGASPYDITALYNDKLEIDGLSPTISLTAGAGRTAAQIVADISAWITANYPGQYSAAVLAEGGKNYVKVTKTQAGIQRLRMTADNVTDRGRIVQAYGTLGFYEGQQDDNAGVSAAEVAEIINAVNKLTASVSRTVFEEGQTGTVASATVIDLPPNSLASTDHANDQILVRTGLNAGYHKIVSVTQYPSADEVVVSPSTPFASFVATNQDWIIIRERLVLTSKSTGMDSEITIQAGTANSALGLTTGSAYGQTTGFRAAASGRDVDFTMYDVVENDILYLTSSVPVETRHTVSSLEDSNRQLEFTPPLSAATALSAFRILSTAAEAYKVFIAAMTVWTRNIPSVYQENTLELDRQMNPLLVNKQPSIAQLNDARNAAQLLRTTLKDLSLVLVAFVVSAVGRIDASLKMLRERGMDKAYDLLMEGKIADFFGMDKDDAASSSFMLKSMRSVVQQDLPVSKLDDDIDDTYTKDTIVGTDPDQDYSDQDTDENLRILGEVPDYDSSVDPAGELRVRL